MEYNRIYNFSSGPAVMPVSVLEQIRDELLNYGHTGMSVMEMSHRSQSFLDIKDQHCRFAKADEYSGSV